ncbi:ABC transporter ATP-binding protein [Bacillus rhizoplanae]
MSLLFVLSIALILLFVLFSLYYLITSKRKVPRQSLWEEQVDQEE